MKRYVNSKTALAAELQVTRQTVYALLKTQGCPKVHSNGKYYVPDWCKFLNRIKHETKNRERDQLALSLLSLKVKRAELESRDFEANLREEIRKEISDYFIGAFNTLAGRLKALPRDLATKCEGMKAQELFHTATELLYVCFDRAREDFGVPDEKAVETK